MSKDDLDWKTQSMVHIFYGSGFVIQIFAYI